MSIQSINGINSLWQTMRTDLQTFAKDFKNTLKAQSSGDQDQVTISQAALQTAAAALQGDLSGMSNVTNGTGSSSANSTTAVNSASATASNPLQTVTQDLAALQSALKSGDQTQIQSAETALEKDLPSISRGHRHHHRHGMQGLETAMAATSSTSGSSDTTSATNASSTASGSTATGATTA